MAKQWVQRMKRMVRALRRGHRNPRQRALAAIGRFRSDATDVAARHDAYFVAALMEETMRRDWPTPH